MNYSKPLGSVIKRQHVAKGRNPPGVCGGNLAITGSMRYGYSGKIRIELSDNTALVESLVDELMNRRLSVKFAPGLQEIDSEFQKLHGKKRGMQFSPRWQLFLG